MSDTSVVLSALDAALPDSKVLDDIAELLWGNISVAAEIELEGGRVRVPRGTQLEIVTKAFFKEYFDVAFQTGYRAQVAIGGVAAERFGVLVAGVCFATIYYNSERHPISVDFHAAVR